MPLPGAGDQEARSTSQEEKARKRLTDLSKAIGELQGEIAAIKSQQNYNSQFIPSLKLEEATYDETF